MFTILLFTSRYTPASDRFLVAPLTLWYLKKINTCMLSNLATAFPLTQTVNDPREEEESSAPSTRM